MSVTLASAPFHQGVALLERGLAREAFPLLREAFQGAPGACAEPDARPDAPSAGAAGGEGPKH
jgi:hypothetical protein